MSQEDQDSINPLSTSGGNFFDNMANAWVNSTVKVLTGGDMSYKDGKIEGKPFHALDETIGEITGRNQTRKATMDAQDALNEEKANKKIEIKNEQTKKGQEDVAASNYAASVRSAAAAKKSNSLGGANSLTPTQDLLGL